MAKVTGGRLTSWEVIWVSYGHMSSTEVIWDRIRSQEDRYGHRRAAEVIHEVIWGRLWSYEFNYGLLRSREDGYDHLRLADVIWDSMRLRYRYIFSHDVTYMRSNENGYGLKGVTWGRSAGFTCDNISSAEVTWSRMIGECCRLCCISIAAYLDIRPFW